MLQFRGSVVTSDAGLLAYRELDYAIGLTVRASDLLTDVRTGKNGRHALARLFRQSVFGPLAGYEDVNDAECLRHDPAMRWIVGGKAAQGCAVSPSQMGRFETRWLASPENLSALIDLSGQWIDLVHGRRPPRGIVLDMDSSVSPTHGEQEMSVWNGHYACTCYHPLFVFNQFAICNGAPCAPAMFGGRMEWRSQSRRGALSGQGLTHLFPGGRSVRHAGGLRVPGSGADQIRDPAAGQPNPAAKDWLLAPASGRTTAERGAPVSYQFQLSGQELDEATPGDRQGRMASGRTLPARRIYRDEHEPPGRTRCCLLQQARDGRAMDQGRQRRDQVDAAVVSDVRRQRGAAPASCARLQPWQLLAHAGDAGADQGLVADELKGKADQDRREGRQPRSLRRLPDGRRRHPTANVRGDFAAHRRTAVAATTSASVRRPMTMRSTSTDGRSAPKCQGKWPDQAARLPSRHVEWRQQSAPRAGLAGKPEKRKHLHQPRIHLGNVGSNSASDMSLGYWSRMTPYFARIGLVRRHRKSPEVIANPGESNATKPVNQFQGGL
jgi:Transposase DDE domain group 1